MCGRNNRCPAPLPWHGDGVGGEMRWRGTWAYSAAILIAVEQNNGVWPAVSMDGKARLVLDTSTYYVGRRSKVMQ